MKTLNKRYKSSADLQKFILKHDIANKKNILLQIFTGVCDEEFILNLINEITQTIPHIHIIGTTTSGEILEEESLENTTILSFSIFETTKIQTYAVSQTDNKQTTYELTKQLLKKFDESPKVVISFADGLHINGEEYMNTMHNFDSSLVIAGGLAGDNQEFIKTFVFTEKGIAHNGIVTALLYGDSLQIATTASFGWEGIGKTMTITKAEKNVVYEIDGTKAVDIYAKYLGEDIADGLPKVGVEFPLIVKRGDLLIPRASLAKNEDGSLVFGGNLQNGDKVTFGYGNIDAILNYSNNLSLSIQPESIFVYSCMARKMLMQESVSFELHPLAKMAPVSGFFTYGEFYTASLKHSLLNETMTIFGLSENTALEKQQRKAFDGIQPKDRRRNSLTLKALSHLISQTSMELEEINATLEKRVEQEVQKNRQKDQMMLHQTKLAQMGEMINMIAHQWRQPLSAISATTNDLHMKVMFDNYSKEYFEEKLQQIEKMSQYLSSTIDDFRGFYKKDKERVSTLFSTITKNVLDIVSVSLKNKNIELITDFNCKKKINTYPNEVRQVILNLIKNAEDVLVEKQIKNPRITIMTYDDSYYSYFEVSDNGGGIPKEIQEKIFEPYSSTKLKKDGTGLGLYMSKTIIEEHCDGEISVLNSDEGALFRLKIPVIKETL